MPARGNAPGFDAEKPGALKGRYNPAAQPHTKSQTMKTQLTALLLSMSVLPLAAQDKKPVPPPAAETAKTTVINEDAAKAKERLEAAAKTKDGKTVVLDVRTPEEFKGGHIAGAVNIDFMEKDFAEKLAKLDKDKTYVVHCQSGRRSTKSLATLQKLGFKSIVHLDSGFSGWQKAGNPVEK